VYGIVRKLTQVSKTYSVIISYTNTEKVCSLNAASVLKIDVLLEKERLFSA